MKTKILKKYNIEIIISILVLITALSLSLILVNKASNKLTNKTVNVLDEFYLKEIADRAVLSITALIDNEAQSVESEIETMCLAKKIYSDSEILEYLNNIERVENLNGIILIGNNGEIYSSNGGYEQYYDNEVIQTITERKITSGKINSNNVLTISFPVSNLRVTNIDIIACIAQVNMEALIDPRMLTPKSEDSMTYTRLFSKEGNSMLNMDSGSMDNSNLFERYEDTATFGEGYSLEKIRNDWKNGYSGYAVYTTEKGNSQIYYEEIEGTGLMVLCLSRLSTINQAILESNNELTRISLTQTIFIIIVFVIFTVSVIWRIYQVRKQKEQTEYIKEITKLNEELDKSRQEAESANSAKTSFLFNMSHDIRTPMNAIIGFRDLLEKHQNDAKKREEYLGKIDDASKVLLSIINNVLEMARIEKGTLELDEKVCNAEQFSDSILSIFHEMMVEKNINFKRQVNVQHPYIYCDLIKMRAIFLNIISNAYKYTNEGGSVSLIIEEIPYEREGYALYRTIVSDTGIGMSEEFLPHIFEEFSRERNTTENKIEGSGLGMPIVKKMIEFMDGTIEVKSVKGEGTTFIVTIPHKIAERSKLVSHDGVVVNRKIFEGRHILLAEDNELNAEITVEILNEAGLTVDVAEDGRVCCDMLKNAEDGYYDLILMDIQMPNMNGYEATRQIRNMQDSVKANIPIVAMTANAYEEDKKEAFKAGMNAHLAKPVEIEDLLRTLAEILK